MWGNFEHMQRAGRLLAQARTLEPGSPKVLSITLYWLRTVGRCAEVIEAAEHAIRIDPNRMRTETGVYNELAVCKTLPGMPRRNWRFRHRRISSIRAVPGSTAATATWASPL